ncbi:MAG: sigma-E processing peptidase SpoIIGA, partial [Clostridia bacterium]|nr:sigma-E processing peptidase SpoIIGA [Clostridia bacterium]
MEMNFSQSGPIRKRQNRKGNLTLTKSARGGDYNISGGRGSMTQTVYVDMLWMINFCMDLLTLGMTARILQRKTTRLRLCLAAALGG